MVLDTDDTCDITYAMFEELFCWMLYGAVETLLVAVMMGWGHVLLDADDADQKGKLHSIFAVDFDDGKILIFKSGGMQCSTGRVLC